MGDPPTAPAGSLPLYRFSRTGFRCGQAAARVEPLSCGDTPSDLGDVFPSVQFTIHSVPQDIHTPRDLAARGKHHEFENGVIERISAGVGVFLTLTEPTKPMIA